MHRCTYITHYNPCLHQTNLCQSVEIVGYCWFMWWVWFYVHMTQNDAKSGKFFITIVNPDWRSYSSWILCLQYYMKLIKLLKTVYTLTNSECENKSWDVKIADVTDIFNTGHFHTIQSDIIDGVQFIMCVNGRILCCPVIYGCFQSNFYNM